MKIDFTKTLKEEQWIKDGMNESLASILKKYVYVGHGIDQTTDEKKHADTKYAYYKLFIKLDGATADTEYTPEELVIIKRVAAICLAPGAYGQVIDLIDGRK